MAIFDQIIGGLTGERSLRRVRDRSIEATRQMYDPSQFDPMADVARRQATQGIDTDMYRRPVLNQLFRPVMDASAFGGSQAAAIAGTASVDAARGQSLAQFESGLMAQDVATRQAGAAQLGAVQAQQNQMSAMRQAMTGQIRAEFEAEKDLRRQKLTASAVNFGIQAAGGPGAIGSAIGGKLSGLFEQSQALSKLPKVGLPAPVAKLAEGAFTDSMNRSSILPTRSLLKPGEIPKFHDLSSQPNTGTVAAQKPIAPLVSSGGLTGDTMRVVNGRATDDAVMRFQDDETPLSKEEFARRQAQQQPVAGLLPGPQRFLTPQTPLERGVANVADMFVRGAVQFGRGNVFFNPFRGPTQNAGSQLDRDYEEYLKRFNR